jgi:hypothetical protein
MRVDIVYLWVDGADPVWQGKRQRAYQQWAGGNPGALAVHGNTAGRYRDNGELRFNLRALERFFPDHGHVYVVTDAQLPSWLCPTERLTVVDHRALLPSGSEGVYDSGNIESYIHHIPGLSEQFLYMNDDVFFGAPVDTRWWFGNRPKVFFEPHRIDDFAELQPLETALVNASIASKQWMGQQYPDYVHEPRVFSHAPRPMLKRALHELEALAADQFARVRSTAFRSWRNPAIVPDLVPRWMVHKGYAEPRILDPLHIQTGASDAELQLQALLHKFGHLPFFCINDTCDDAALDDPRLVRVRSALEALLPTPSSFELAFADGEAARLAA